VAIILGWGGEELGMVSTLLPVNLDGHTCADLTVLGWTALMTALRCRVRLTSVPASPVLGAFLFLGLFSSVKWICCEHKQIKSVREIQGPLWHLSLLGGLRC
jgi:lipid-A-disaccharide synthase-like uncharacterized protein